MAAGMARVSRLPLRPRSRAAVAAFAPPLRPPFGIGHNKGPPLGGGYARHVWKKAHGAAWKAPPPEVLRRRVKLAAACGLTYREYALEIMERGRFLMPERDAARIAEIIAARTL
jgi:hypothetical protein